MADIGKYRKVAMLVLLNECRPKIEGHEAYHEAGLSLLVAQFAAMGESVDYSVRP